MKRNELGRLCLALGFVGGMFMQFDLRYNHGRRYEPDFVVETEKQVCLVEIKRHDQVEDDNVKLKRERAVTYCAAVTEWAKANGCKPWTHLFIPDDEVTATRTFGDYVTGFAVVKEYNGATQKKG